MLPIMPRNRLPDCASRRRIDHEAHSRVTCMDVIHAAVVAPPNAAAGDGNSTDVPQSSAASFPAAGFFGSLTESRDNADDSTFDLRVKVQSMHGLAVVAKQEFPLTLIGTEHPPVAASAWNLACHASWAEPLLCTGTFQRE